MANLESEAAEQQRRLDAAEAALGELRTLMRQTAIDAYVGSAAEPRAQLMLGDDINRQVQAEALVAARHAGQRRHLDQYRALAEDAEAARAELEGTIAQQRDAVESLRQRRAALQAELSRLEELERAAPRRGGAAQPAGRRRRGPSGGGSGSRSSAHARRSSSATSSARCRARSRSSTRGARPAPAAAATRAST